MQHKLLRLAIGVPEALNALSAIGGGTALLLGTYKDGVLIEAGGQASFPLKWLQDTPFSDYTIPALIAGIWSEDCDTRVRSSAVFAMPL